MAKDAIYRVVNIAIDSDSIGDTFEVSLSVSAIL
jgi:hypothetical protein